MSILGDSLAQGLKQVTKDFTKAKHRAGERGMSARDWARLRAQEKREERETIKNAAWEAMAAAYALASDNGRLPANARQIMYAARPLVLTATGGKCWEKSQYFTQHLLPDYMEEHPDETTNWDVVFDARGHLHEPHTDYQLGLGTLEVRNYIAGWRALASDKVDPYQMEIEPQWPSRGPANRYKFALFIEKEGFNALIEQSQIRERYDIMVFSSKGMSVTSARRLVEALSAQGVTILVAHDFDLSGLTICHTLGHDTRRYRFKNRPKVIDIGLRLEDVQDMNLESEPVVINQRQDPRAKFRREYNGVAMEELDFLVDHFNGSSWSGERVELNAMTSAQFVDWLELKFEEHGVEKVIPDEATLAVAWQRAYRIVQANRAIPEIITKINAEQCAPPADLAERIREQLKPGEERSWDEILMDMVQKGNTNDE